METTALVLGVAGLLMLAISAMLARRPSGDAARLAAIERRLQLIMDHLDVAEPKPETTEIEAYLAAGQKIQAIKLYRERTGVGLKEAKDAVEAIARGRGY